MHHSSFITKACFPDRGAHKTLVFKLRDHIKVKIHSYPYIYMYPLSS